MTILSTGRLLLRRFEPSDAEGLHAIYQEPGVWTHYLGQPPSSVAQTRESLRRHQEYYRQHGFGFWATLLRETGQLIGRCGLLSQVVDGQPEVEIAYLLSPRFWGRGLASEAARGIRDWALASLPTSRIIALIRPANVASKHVAIAAGLTFERNTMFAEHPVELFALGGRNACRLAVPTPPR